MRGRGKGELGSSGEKKKRERKELGLRARKQRGSCFPFSLVCFFSFISKPFLNQFETILNLLKVTQYKNINAPA